MKTLIHKAVLVLVLAMVARAEAQANEEVQGLNKSKLEHGQSIELIPNIGVTSFRLVNSSSDLSSRGGISAGMLADIPTPVDGLIFETGLDYFEAGGKSSDVFGSVEIALGYLAIPLEAKYELYNSGETIFFAKGGAKLAFLMTSKQKVEAYPATVETDIKDQTNKVDYIGVLALGGEMAAAGGKVSLELEYDKGTQKTFKDQGDKIEGYILRLGYVISI